MTDYVIYGDVANLHDFRLKHRDMKARFNDTHFVAVIRGDLILGNNEVIGYDEGGEEYNFLEGGRDKYLSVHSIEPVNGWTPPFKIASFPPIPASEKKAKDKAKKRGNVRKNLATEADQIEDAAAQATLALLMVVEIWASLTPTQKGRVPAAMAAAFDDIAADSRQFAGRAAKQIEADGNGKGFKDLFKREKAIANVLGGVQ